MPTPDQLRIAQSTTITFTDGSTLATLGGENRKSIPLSQVPVGVRSAVLAAEDHSFYSESGISVRGIGRAFYRDVRGGTVLEGGSTITQQYAKNAYLTQDRTFTRKFREIVLAVKLDQRYSKDQILEFYLNTIYFGRGAFGIERAAETYFGVPASRLSAPQGAVLAGLIRGPSLYDPALHPKAAATRFEEVISEMRAANTISPGDAAAPAPTTKQIVNSSGGTALRPDLAYLRDAIVQELAVHGISEAAVNRSGLTVKTTIQRRAEDAAWVASMQTLKGAPADLQIGLSAVDPTSGAIRASVGGLVYKPAGVGADVTDNEFNSQVQPGSTFKTVVLSAALAKGISSDSVYAGNSPEQLPGTSYTGAHPLTNDAGDPAYGALSLTSALAHSVNTVFVPLGMQVGDDKVASLGHTMGIPAGENLDPQPSLALGTSPIHPLDVTSVYATVAAGGYEHDPYLVASVTDTTRHAVYTAHPTGHRALNGAVAHDATAALQAVVTSGTGTNAALTNGRPVAGKTGTTATSALFAGFTPQLAASVAIFYEDNRPLTGIAGLTEVYGATLPATAFKQFMDAALAGEPSTPFPTPSQGGQAMSDICPPPPGTVFLQVPGGPDCGQRTTSAARTPTASGSSTPSPSDMPTPGNRQTAGATSPPASLTATIAPLPTASPSPATPTTGPPAPTLTATPSLEPVSAPPTATVPSPTDTAATSASPAVSPTP